MISESTILYLAGPMSGIEQFNFPGFDAAAARLRMLGYIVINPTEEDPPDMRASALESVDGDALEFSEDLHDVMRRNLDGVLRSHGVALLPGWQRSLGARQEVETANRLDLPVALVPFWAAVANRYHPKYLEGVLDHG